MYVVYPDDDVSAPVAAIEHPELGDQHQLAFLVVAASVLLSLGTVIDVGLYTIQSQIYRGYSTDIKGLFYEACK